MSLRSRLVYTLLRIIRRKQRFASVAGLRAAIARDRRAGRVEPSRRMVRRLRVQCHELRGSPVYTLAPRREAGAGHVLYLHGGAYVFGIARQHWQFLARLVDRLGCTITVPLYPLAPEHTHEDALALAVRVYRDLARAVAPSELTLMGDSAGGGMSLALAQLLAGERLPQPAHVVLLAPWLDATMSDPATASLEPLDPMLAAPGLVEAGRMYAGRDDPRDPRISPLYGRLDGLAPLSLFVGTRDILLVDARRLRARAAAEGVPLDYLELDGMFHGWVVLPLPEAAQVVEQITAIVARTPRYTQTLRQA
jgi:acetyl esterase/lipase